MVAPNTPVTWTVEEGFVGGTITQSGTYTAPANLGIYHVVATATADTSRIATVTITVVQSGFAYVGSMATPRAAHTATRLLGGKVLIVDGGFFDIDDLLIPIASAELFDAASNKFDVIANPSATREFHTATALLNGKVLIVGGSSIDTPPGNIGITTGSTSAELYDPVTGTFAKTGSMTVPRQGHSATLLPDGRVLVVGGSSDLTAEIYDPVTGTFSITGSSSTARFAHTATPLPNGKVLIIGGKPDFIQTITAVDALASTEIYDPALGIFLPSGSMASARTGHTATLLNNGTVLVIGGANAQPVASTEIYDASTGQFSIGAVMSVPRANHTATLLGNGQVLVIGGIPEVPAVYVGYAPTSSAELYDPASNSFSEAGSMADGRFWHSATLLDDGRTLVIGGGHSDAPLFGADSVATAEIYH